MALTAHDALRAACATLPEAEEFVSHGMPCFRIRRGKTFAMFAVNHHGDGRVALWLAAPPGAQAVHVGAGPRHYFVPAYVGRAGWIGLRLDRRIGWPRVVERLREAWTCVAPPRLRAQLPAAPRLPAPDRGLTLDELDPMRSKQAVRAVTVMRELCLALPGTSEDTQFGKPVWRVGKRVFAQCYCYDGPVYAAFHVGAANQALMTGDPRYSIPAYLGHRGWIQLDVTRGVPRGEVGALLRDSHRHFAPRRLR